MADKMTCPACDAHLSSVLMAFEEGQPCPNCGLPAEAAVDVLAARKRGASEVLTQKYAAAETRAAKAEAEVRKLRAKLDRIKWELESDAPDD